MVPFSRPYPHTPQVFDGLVYGESKMLSPLGESSSGEMGCDGVEGKEIEPLKTGPPPLGCGPCAPVKETTPFARHPSCSKF